MSELLNAIYKELDFEGGKLLSATDAPISGLTQSDWLEKGEWLAAAKRAGAEKVFFVKNNPVAVFTECGASMEDRVKAFNRAWCLARPRLLFLASPGEIKVYDLAQRPVDESNQNDWSRLKSLETLYETERVAEKLQEFHRDNIESGHIFGDRRFGDLSNRADKALIRDLQVVRRELMNDGLSGERIRFAHALIGRSIFIRYLEDRGVLSEDYFHNVAAQTAGWTELLSSPANRPGIDFSEHPSLYSRVLADKSYTYALFRALARDFNGDMFPNLEAEEEVVTEEHLLHVQELLYGDVGKQKSLFFYSYRFDIVPLDLISSIYEEFYHPSTRNSDKKSTARQDGAYYTPTVLAEFVLSHVLTVNDIEKKPRILDAACGSGIFLVEAFRRIVRYEWRRKKSPLAFADLEKILKEQISGIEVNEEAARITAFSLYLSLLHYLDPPAIDRHIKQGNKLPYLLASENHSENCCHCILVGNAFDVDYIESDPIWKERFGNGCADIIVGNPPWGKPDANADKAARDRQEIMLGWCDANNMPIGNKEQSQAFLWRALEFLKEGGKAGMLVPAGVLLKRAKSKEFRERWINSVRLTEVFNFTHVRKVFFKADSPFLAIFFSKATQNDIPVYYWSAKHTIFLDKVQSILFSKQDLHILRDEKLDDSAMWKTYWLGQYADRQLIQILNRQKKLATFVDRQNSGRGYQLTPPDIEAKSLKGLKDIKPISSRYEPLEFDSPPLRIHRRGAIGAYSGLRVLVNEGIVEHLDDKGQIIARYESEPFCFFRSSYGIRLKDQCPEPHKLLVGILWSSLARYYFFMTTSNWGVWHHKILLDDELLQLPVILDKEGPIAEKIISIVDQLRAGYPQGRDFLHYDDVSEVEAKRKQWEAELDEAVFELYDLTEAQRDLVRDCCEVTLPFLYKSSKSVGATPAVQSLDLSWIETYARVFARRWNAYLPDDQELSAEIHVGAHGNMVGIEFFPIDKGDLWNLQPKEDSWHSILEQIGKALPQPVGSSQIVLDGIVHAVSSNAVIIVKRNEKRFWTRSLAREDAEATLCKAMIDTGKA
jgi:type I restriction-modification system DNA methylase subunit